MKIESGMTDGEKQLFIADFQCVCGEYFEVSSQYSVDIVPTPGGFSVCIVFDAARVRNFKKPR